MAHDSSATVRSETPHLSAAIKRRAQSLINNKAIDAGTRTVLRYGLEIDDPSLADLVRRLNVGESIIDNRGFLQIEDMRIFIIKDAITPPGKAERIVRFKLRLDGPAVEG